MSLYVEVEIDDVVMQTNKAVCVRIEGEEVWISWSQIEDCWDPTEPMWWHKISVTQRIADQKDLVY